MTDIHRTPISSADGADTRALRIMEHAGIDTGDPAIVQRHRVRIAELIAAYQQVDADATPFRHRGAGR